MRRAGENYGIQNEYGGYSAPEYRPPTVTATKNERTWSVLAHLSTFANVFTGFLGPVFAFVIWLAKRNDSPMVASHALRSVVYQLVWLTVMAFGWAVTWTLAAVLIGFLLVPFMALVTVAPFVHASVAAYDAYKENKVYL